MKKKILMIVNYFYPDVASVAQLMTELCSDLQDDFDITVIAAFPSYVGEIPESYYGKYLVKEKYQNVKILRVKVPLVDKKNKLSRINYIVSYFVNSIFAIIKSGKQDVVFTISQPPILGGILGVIGKIIKRAKLVYSIQDFNPEQIEAVKFSKNKLLIEAARKFDNFTCRLSDTVVIVGRDMQDTLYKRFKNTNVPKSVVINNWIDEESIFPLESNNPKVLAFKEKYNLLDKFVIMYSGNIGLFYDLENIIKVIGNYKDRDDVVFAFIGDGAVKSNLQEYCDSNGLGNVKFIPYQDKDELIYSLNAADVHIVTNAKGIKGVSVPSKIYGVMAVGKPILGILEENTEARRLIEESDCGLCCSPGEYENIDKLINTFIASRNELSSMGENGRKKILSSNRKFNSMEKYGKLFSEI